MSSNIFEPTVSRKPGEILLDFSVRTETPRSNRYTDDMFPLDDLVIVPGYSLDSMGFGERTVEKISPSMAESYEMVETSMCVPEQPKKKKKEGENTRDKDQNLRSVPEIKNENDNPAVPDDQKAEVEGDKGVLQNLVNLGYDFLSLFSTPQ